eukprot:16313-Heterococcus_DN1.PRE.4
MNYQLPVHYYCCPFCCYYIAMTTDSAAQHHCRYTVDYYDDIEYGYANGGLYTSSGIGGELGDDMMILVFDTTSGLHYYWCKGSQAHEESCVSNGLRMYAAEMVMDQGQTWLAQAGKLIDWRKAANGLGKLPVV